MRDKVRQAREAMERKEARLLEQAAAIRRDMAELDRITAKYLDGSEERPAAKRGRPRKKEQRVAEGTIAHLINCYRTDKRSPYHKLRFRTRANYDNLLAIVQKACGDEKLTDFKAQRIEQLYNEWAKRGTSMAHGLVTMLRILFGFGATKLEDSECVGLSVVLHKMHFKTARRRTEGMTAEHANKIRAIAWKVGQPSIALAQAFQFDCQLRQRDVIGEWVPNSEPGVSDVTYGNEKWLRGLRWSEINENRILRHVMSSGQKEIEIDLKLAPMVMEELAKTQRRDGPVIISENTGRPYTAHEFRRYWRIIADQAEVPKGVFNMDSRSGPKSRAVQGETESAH
jgi:hypothetical protein